MILTLVFDFCVVIPFFNRLMKSYLCFVCYILYTTHSIKGVRSEKSGLHRQNPKSSDHIGSLKANRVSDSNQWKLFEEIEEFSMTKSGHNKSSALIKAAISNLKSSAKSSLNFH